MAKPGKADSADAESPPKPKSKILLLAFLGLLVLGAIGGGGWYFLKGSSHPEEHKKVVVDESTFMVLEPFTVNLQREEIDQFLQIGITLKVSSMGLADKIRQRLPEVRSRLLFLLSSKRASELMPTSGKKKLALEIKTETNAILGLGATTHANNEPSPEAEATPPEEPQGESPDTPAEGTPATSGGGETKGGVMEVLFTSFIIQ